jgi:hypothetical protein
MKVSKIIPADKVYRLVSEAAPLSVMIATKSSARSPLLWYDTEQNINRVLRYARNQKSPFEDEQDGNVILEPVVFEDGLLRVAMTNPVLQEFLSYHPKNGVLFEEMNNEKDAAEVVEQLNIELDALLSARELSLEQLEIVGRVLFGKAAGMTTTSELKRDLLIYAKRDPHGFMNILEDPALQLRSKVQIFFDQGLLSFRKNQTEIWFNTSSNKKRMLVVPYGEDPMHITSSYLQSDEGIESLKMLENYLTKD